MPDNNQAPQQTQGSPEGMTQGDPNVGESGMDELLRRVEGQNENVTTPPKDVEGKVAETARDVDDLTIGN